jgi:ribosomal-protein-alanine N-acetyltransferase
VITPVSAALAPALSAIHADCFSGADAWNAASIAVLLATPGVVGFVHDGGGSFGGGGFILLRCALDEADIVTLAVSPQARRRGIARALLAAALADAHARGIVTVFLEVAETNSAAIGLYRSAGFEVAGLRPSYYADGAAALLMRRRLDSV